MNYFLQFGRVTEGGLVYESAVVLLLCNVVPCKGKLHGWDWSLEVI